MDLLKEYGKMLREPQEPTKDKIVMEVIDEASEMDLTSVSISSIGGDYDGDYVATRISTMGFNVVGITNMRLPSFEVSSDGSFITRNSNNEEVIRIDIDGIRINGRLVISSGGISDGPIGAV